MLNKYIAPTVRTTKLVVYWVRLPSGMEVSVITIVDNVKQGILDMFKSIYNEFKCSPMIKVVSETELSYITAIQHQSLLYEYFDKQKYNSKSGDWYGIEDSFVVSSKDMSRALNALLDGRTPTKQYVTPGCSDLSF